MKERRIFYTELAYLIGIVCTALGVALMEKADFGVSMVVAPAYIIFRKVSLVWSSFTFGMAEYLFQAFLLIVMWIIIRKFRISDCFSFITAFIYGLVLDLCINLVSCLTMDTFPVRILSYILGMVTCSVGISLMFHTYIAPEVYELFVKKLADYGHMETHRFKTIYDIASCFTGVLLSFILFGFGKFIGVKLGTVICALINGKIIGFISAFFDKHFTFKDLLPFRSFFMEDISSTPSVES